jgi:DNA anti-recombination protein RmuC
MALETLLLLVTVLLSAIALATVVSFWLRQRGVEDRLRAEVKDSREELSANVARTQTSFHSQLMELFQEVNVNLRATDQKWVEVRGLGQNVEKLLDVFERPAQRGRILGEVTLERLVRDVLPTGYFEFQAQIDSGRVDVLIHFPASRVSLPIDSKFVSGANSVVRAAKEVAAKYIRPDLGTTPFAYLYLPTQSLWDEAASDAKVFATLQDLRVYPVSPNTLALMLQPIALAVGYFERSDEIKTLMKRYDAMIPEWNVFLQNVEDSAQAQKKNAEKLQQSAQKLRGTLGL